MGAGSGKYTTYEDAVAKLGPADLLRLREAWQQLVTGSSATQPGLPLREDVEGVTVPRSHFVRSVLGGRFPNALQERIFYAFSGKNKEFLSFGATRKSDT